MKARLPLLSGACWVLVLGGVLVTGLPKAVYAQDSLRVGETGVWIGINTDTARVVIPATGETTLVIRVTEIHQGGPADQGGVLPGDVLVALNGRELVNYDVWLSSLAALGPGQQAHLKINRGGAEMETTVVVADARPPSFPYRLDLPDVDDAWAALQQDLEALIATLPDTLGPGVELSATIRRGILVDSSGVYLMFSDTSMTLGIARSDSARIVAGPAPVADAPGAISRLRAADPGGPAQRRAAEVERIGTILGGAYVRTLSSELGRYFDESSGVLVVDVLAGSPARRAGFRPGDVIVAVGGLELATLAQLRSDLAVADLPVTVTVIRHKERVEVTFPVR